ncbi:MAG TPA: threonine/serine exporter family protein [Solirubrobacterales bacterium]|nr:threonine/serine exporter family protein [Solirubrobacterales bacterium]
MSAASARTRRGGPPAAKGGTAGPVDPDELRVLLVALGGAMNAAGEAVNEIEDRLRLVAAAYGAPAARVMVLPTFLAITLGPAETPVLEETRQFGGTFRLDQTAALFDLLKRAERAEVTPADGLATLTEIIDRQPRFRPWTRIAGHTILTIGICLVLHPTAADVAVAAVLGAAVGAFRQFGSRWPTIQVLMPVLVAAAVSAVALALVRAGWRVDLRAMLAPLVTFLPGAALTMGTIEIAAGEMVAGSSRLISGSLHLLLLAFGIIAGAQLVGEPSEAHLITAPANLLGDWSPWLGVFVFGVGVWIYFSGPSLFWLCVVLYAAWVGQVIGDQLFGAYVSAFCGALVMTPVAYLVERQASGPPALVTFLPAFWLLVPGALGLVGVTELLGIHGPGSLANLLGTFGAIAGIALGVLCGYPIYRSAVGIATQISRLPSSPS